MRLLFRRDLCRPNAADDGGGGADEAEPLMAWDGASICHADAEVVALMADAVFVEQDAPFISFELRLGLEAAAALPPCSLPFVLDPTACEGMRNAGAFVILPPTA